MFAFMKQPEYKPAETGPAADARYRRMRWQVFIGAFIGYAGFYLVRKNLSMAIPSMDSILFGAMPDAVVLCHRPNHPFREPIGIQAELAAIEAVEPTKVIALSINRRNDNEFSLEETENEFNLPTVDIHTNSNGGLKRLIETVLEYVGEN